MIGLLWHTLRSPNLGVDALTRANLAILEAAAERVGIKPEYQMLGLLPSDGGAPDLPRVTQGPAPSLKALTRAKFDYFRAVRRCRLVIDISEGDSFADIYGPRRFLLQAMSKAAVIQAGVPLVLAPQTIGPFEKGWAAKLAGAVMRRARAVFARDHLSTALLNRMNIAGNTAEYIDVAFRLPFDSPKPRAADGLLRIGINVSGLLFAGESQFGMTLDYAALTRRLIETFSARNGVELWLVPHVIAPGTPDDDVAASHQLAAEYPNLRVAPTFGTSTEAKSFIAGLDLLVAARMHASIAAFSSGVPVVPIAYSRKFNGLYGTLGYHFLIDGRSDTTDAAYAMVMDAVDRRKEMQDEIEAGMKIAHKRLAAYEDFLVGILREIGNDA
jgi:colanic acid/amylovoran biosynthesis protein